MSCQFVTKPKDLPKQKHNANLKTLGDWVKSALEKIYILPDESASSIYALVSFVMQKPVYFGIAHPEYQLESSQFRKLNLTLDRLLAGEPLPYITGNQEFFGLNFKINRDVLIPRPETELLVSLALDWLSSHPGSSAAVDVGTGCGCIAVSICVRNPNIGFVATDNHYPPLAVAAENIHLHHLEKRIRLLQTDLLSGIQSKFDLICANLPYIPAERLETLKVSVFEPLAALDGGSDGFALIKELIVQSQSRIKENGVIFLEIDYSQEKVLRTIARSVFPFACLTVMEDLAGLPRVLKIEMLN